MKNFPKLQHKSELAKNTVVLLSWAESTSKCNKVNEEI
jgi:hypothetical protein